MPDTIDGRYEILEVLGRGSFGETLLAREIAPDRRVAIKTLHTARADDLKAFELFDREATVLRGLRHQGIPAIVDAFRAEWQGNDAAFLVMEYIEGPTLDRLITDGHTFSTDDVLALVLDLAGILEYLHERIPPILHRDIKPANVILRGGRSPVLVDFGAVRNVFRTADESGSTVVGTYGYMPYEQYMGQATPASDLYALGATLLHLLTGRPPADFLTEESRLDVPDHVPGGDRMRAVLKKLLAPSAADRFPSATALRRALLNVPAETSSGVLAVVHGASVPTVARAEATLADLPAAPRSLDGSTLAHYRRVAPSTWSLMSTLAGPGAPASSASTLWIAFISLASFGVLPLAFWLGSIARRSHLKPFFRDGLPAVARIQAITIGQSAVGERGVRVTYEFEGEGQVHRGSDQVLPAVADRWREGDAVPVLYLPNRDFDSVIVPPA